MSKMSKGGIAAVGIVAAVVLAVVITVVSVSAASTGSLQNVEAVAVLNAGPAGRTVQGTITLTQECPEGLTHITGTVSGIKPDAMVGFHIHQSGDLRNEKNPCLSTGGHYNPFNKTHGAPEDEIRHVGDLGNIQSDSNGVATIDINDRMVKLCGETSVIGRAFVVHEMTDDLGKDGGDSKVTGNAGGRAACGLIGVIYKAA
jgi:Cu-Zn family superoxide dismutase